MAFSLKNVSSCIGNLINVHSKGSVLLLSVLVLMIVFTLGTGLLAVATSNYIMDQAEHDYQAAFYAAEAGLRHQMEVMKAEMDRLYQEGSYTNASAFFGDFWGRIQKSVTLELDTINNKPVKAVVTTGKGIIGNDYQEYSITSVGSVGRIKRTLESTVRIRYVSSASDISALAALFNHAVFANGKIELDNSAKIYGNAGTNTTITGGVVLKGSTFIDGDVIIGPNGNVDQVISIPQWGNINNFIKGDRRTNQSILKFPKIEPMGNIVFPSGMNNSPPLVVQGNSSFVLNQGGQFSMIRVSNSGKLTVNLGEDNIYTEEIVVEGDGRLDIYINGNAEIYARTIRVNNSGELTIYANGDKRVYVENLIVDGYAAIFTLQGEGRLLFFVEKSFVRGGSGAINRYGDSSKLIVFFNGNNIKLGENGSRDDPYFIGGIYAPNTEVIIERGAVIRGSVVASSIKLIGNATVDFRRVINEGDPLLGSSNRQIDIGVFTITSYQEK